MKDELKRQVDKLFKRQVVFFVTKVSLHTFICCNLKSASLFHHLGPLPAFRAVFHQRTVSALDSQASSHCRRIHRCSGNDTLASPGNAHMLRVAFIGKFCINVPENAPFDSCRVSSDADASDGENIKISRVIRPDIWQTRWLWLLSSMIWIYMGSLMKTWRSWRWQEVDIRSQLIPMLSLSHLWHVWSWWKCRINIQDIAGKPC